MSRYWSVFLTWFGVLMLVFLVANVWGFVNAYPKGSAGFPFAYVRWGIDLNDPVDIGVLVVDIVIAIAVSALFAQLCATCRTRRERVEKSR